MTSLSILVTNGTCLSNLEPESQGHRITLTRANLTHLVEKTTAGKSLQRVRQLMAQTTSITPDAATHTKSMK